MYFLRNLAYLKTCSHGNLLAMKSKLKDISIAVKSMHTNIGKNSERVKRMNTKDVKLNSKGKKKTKLESLFSAN